MNKQEEVQMILQEAAQKLQSIGVLARIEFAETPNRKDEADGSEVGTKQFEYAENETRLVKDRGVIVFLETESSAEPYDGYGLIGN